jgi:nucleoid DNA-binding protein
VTGVIWRKKDKLWFATLMKGGKYVLQRYFKTMDEAVAARKEAELIHFGQFAPQSFTL